MISFLMNRRVSGVKVRWKWSVIVKPGLDHNIGPDIVGFLHRVLWRGGDIVLLPTLHSQPAIKIIKIQPGRERGSDQGVRIRW